MTRPTRARALHLGLAILLALGWSGALAAWHLDGRATVADRIEAALLDLRIGLVGPRPPPADLVIVALDDALVGEVGAYPLPRSVIARLVGEISRARPKAIGIDLLLLDARPDDEQLSEALQDSGAIIGAAALFDRTQDARARSGPLSDVPVARTVSWPTERLAKSAGIGLVNLATDYSGTPRHVPLIVNGGGSVLPSLALLIASTALGQEPAFENGRIVLGKSTSRLDLGRSLPLRFYGPRGTIATVAAGAVLTGETAREDLAGRVVMIGATAIGTGDTFATPFDPAMPGVEVLATAVAHLLAGDGLVRDTKIRWIDAIAGIVLACSATLLLSLAPGALAVGATLLLALSWLGATVVAFSHGIWLNAALPLAALAPAMLFALAGRLILDRRATRRLARVEQAFSVFQPPALVSRIADDPAFLAAPRRQDAGIVFVDISGFTPFSRRIGAERTERFLKGFHAIAEELIAEKGGVVVNFMGDGAMGIFGLPEPESDDARNTLIAAYDLVPRLREWLKEAGGPALDCRVGAHWGEVVIARLGAAAHQQITAVGDSVNVASRLMEVGKELRAALVASEDLVAAAEERGPVERSFAGTRPVTLRGSDAPLRVAYGWETPRQAPLPTVGNAV